ncbi:MAG: hypothetical protein GXP19_09675 [Gammaproteobacteria bacterium]|nr:hypothetical protein [Gammaproteobacteria bacterium]
MNIKLLFTTILVFTLTACIDHTKVNYDGIGSNISNTEGIKLGTIPPALFKTLGIDGERTLIGGSGADGSLILLGRTNTDFVVTDKKPRGKPIRSTTINVYQNSPLCYEIDTGGGTSFWYPADCPHQ